jgi:hypothetical protein
MSESQKFLNALYNNYIQPSILAGKRNDVIAFYIMYRSKLADKCVKSSMTHKRMKEILQMVDDTIRPAIMNSR